MDARFARRRRQTLSPRFRALRSSSVAAPAALTMLALSFAPSAQTIQFATTAPAGVDQLGGAVAVAGDVDGDGEEVWIVGAPQSPLTNGTLPGFARVLSGIDGALLLELTGELPGDGFGFAVGTVGDLDADGHDDVIVGSPFHSDPVKGAEIGNVRIFSGADGSELRSIDGSFVGMQFGHAVTGVGDVSGDGVPDWSAGSPRDRQSFSAARVGSVRVHSGTNSAQIARFEGKAEGDRFGAAIARVPDLNGDATDELVIGAPQTDDPTASGYARVLAARNGVLFFEVTAASGLSDEFGAAVAMVGDADCDDVPDVAVGAPWAGAGSGSAYLLSGVDGTVLRVWFGDPGDALGTSLAAAGDVDGDGRDDLALGLPGANGAAGRVEVRSGLDGSVVLALDGALPDQRLGSAVAGGVDVHGDATPELLAGAAGTDAADSPLGEAVAFQGAQIGLTADLCGVSLSAGGTVAYELRGGAANAGSFYWLLGSVTGTGPGIYLGGNVIAPLGLDKYTLFTIKKPNAQAFTGFQGMLGSDGGSQATVTVPPGTDPSIAGIVLYHAYLAASTFGVPDYASNPVPVELVP